MEQELDNMVSNYYATADCELNSSSDTLLDDDSLDSSYIQLSKQETNTSAMEARNGKDIQGIPWDRLIFTRENYRETRLSHYRNFVNLPLQQGDLKTECKQVEKGHTFYDFQFNTRLVKSTVVHFQLRNLLWATSKHDVYLLQNYSVMHWSSLLRRGKEILNVVKPLVPTMKYPDSLGQTLSRMQISTMAVKHNLLVAGGFRGELLCKYLDQHGVAFCTKLAMDENAITNDVDIYHTTDGSVRVMTANNNAKVIVFDAINFDCINSFPFPWSVNNTSVSPDGKLFSVLGDSTTCLVADVQSGKVVGTLDGHLDYSFTSAWHPDGNILATGNQDTSCRLWDIRNLSHSLAVLKGRMGAIRAIRYSLDGRFMAMAEAADFVHVYDTRYGYSKAQEIDLFGEIAGISFSPDTEALYIGIADRTYGSLLEYNRKRCDYYLDSFM